MRYLVLALLAAVAGWYFFMRVDSNPANVHAVAISPEQQFRSALAGGAVSAAQLASLCSSYPQLGLKLLNGKQIRIDGTVAEVRTSGLEGRRADVLLNDGGSRKIVLICDLDQYNGTSVNFRYLGKFEVVGTELLYLLQRRDALTKKVITTQGALISQSCSLKSMGASLVEFQMVNGPLWANAEASH